MIVVGLTNAWNALKSACVCWNGLMSEMMAWLISLMQKIILQQEHLVQIEK